VRDIAQQACDNLWSLGVAMQTCNLPGSDDEEGRIKQGHVELGLGIHGEPGLPSWIRKTAKPLSTRW
jgi:dihydroxyacetone kinase